LLKEDREVQEKKIMDMPHTREDIEDFLDRLFPDRCIEKVLLVNPPDSHSELFRYDTAKRGRYSSYPPYGLAVLAQNLRDIGIDVEICNLNYEILKECYELEDETKLDFDGIWHDLLDRDIESFQPDFIGITCMFTMSHESLKRVCARASSKKIPFGVGGVHMSYDQAYVLDDIPTIPTIPAIRTTKGDKLLPPETNGTITAFTSLHSNLNFIKHYIICNTRYLTGYLLIKSKNR